MPTGRLHRSPTAPTLTRLLAPGDFVLRPQLLTRLYALLWAGRSTGPYQGHQRLMRTSTPCQGDQLPSSCCSSERRPAVMIESRPCRRSARSRTSCRITSGIRPLCCKIFLLTAPLGG